MRAGGLRLVASKRVVIDASPDGRLLHHKELNDKIREAIRQGYEWIVVKNVCGQRFIGAGITAPVTIEVFGDAGLDLGAFFAGKRIIVHGCSEYLLGNTINEGEIIVYGDSWDVAGMGARGGSIWVMGDGGSRVGLHMKEYRGSRPVLVYGGRVKQYCGEYMAGGIIVVLGLDFRRAVIDRKRPISKRNIDPSRVRDAEGEVVQPFLATGIHGGVIYVRGEVPNDYLGKYAKRAEFEESDRKTLEPILKKFCQLFNAPLDMIQERSFTKVVPYSHRPFERVYSTTLI